MSSYKPAQYRMSLRGRQFHFVSYEGQPANPAQLRLATEPTWYMMSAGKRWAVMPQVPGQDDGELERLFTGWLEANVFAGGAP